MLAGVSTICNRSTQAYPYTVAQQTGLTLQHYACIGAEADEKVFMILNSVVRRNFLLSLIKYFHLVP